MEKYGFFSSINNDRLYTAEDFTSYFARFLQNGYFSVNENGLKVMANGTLELSVLPGTAWINGHVYELTEIKKLLIEPTANLARKDRVVIKLDYVERKIYTEIKKGEPSDNPTYPTLQRDDDAYELCIAQYHIDKGITQMYQDYIQDMRKDINSCGEVTSILDKRTLQDFCQVAGFTMNGTIHTKDVMPWGGEANIGSEDNRYKKIYAEDIDVLNGLPYLPINGGTLEGYLYTQMLIPTVANSYNLGLKDKAFGQAHIKDLFVYGNSPFIKKEGDTVAGKIKFNDLEANSLKINGKRVFIQSTPPVGASDGDVWIKC